MLTTVRRTVLALVLSLCAVRAATAQTTGTASLSGKVMHPNNVAHAGERVLLYDFATKKWIGPALTDDFGAYAFYGIAPGSYVLSLYVAGKAIWSAKITLGTTPSRYDIAAPS